MQGRRVYPGPDGRIEYAALRPGDYYRVSDAGWFGLVPNGLMCSLAGHGVEEHADGTITVSPSILVSNGEGGQSWHGYLERGVWREC